MSIGSQIAAALRRLRSPSSGLKDIYGDWESARRKAGSYDTDAIRQAVVAAAERASRSDDHLFDRDGHVFDCPITPFPLLTCLLKLASENSARLHIVDFGGALGATFRQCRPFLSQLSDLRWTVVEQPAIVRIGIDRFQNKTLKFADSLADAARTSTPDAIIFSGVLQYLDDPYAVLHQTLELDPAMVIVDRNPFSARAEDVFSVQIVAQQLFPARLPFRIFGVDAIERMLAPRYRKFAEFETVDPNMKAGSVAVRFLGQAFERSPDHRKQ